MNMNSEKNPQPNIAVIEAQESIDRFDALWDSPIIAEKTADILETLTALEHEWDISKLHEVILLSHVASVKLVMDFTTLESDELTAISTCLDLTYKAEETDWFAEFNEWMYGIADKKIILQSGNSIRASSERIWRLYMDLQFLRIIKDLVRTPLKNAIQQMIQLYALGQDAACILMCRTAIELALMEKIRYHTLEKYNKAKGHCTINDRLIITQKEKKISDKAIKMAQDTVLRANKIAHEDPGLSANAGKYIGNTMGLLTAVLTGKCLHAMSISEYRREFGPKSNS
jgi:hypothetical protein